MAGDWIKMRTDLYRDPKVCLIADALMQLDGDLAGYVNQHCQRDMTVTRNVMRNVTVGALVAVWGVMRTRGRRVEDDLLSPGASLSVIDDVADLPGFGEAMASVGWAIESTEGVVFPRFFGEFNVDPADEIKAKNAARQRKYRERQTEKCNVTPPLRVTSHSNAREEKRREENIYIGASAPPPNPQGGIVEVADSESTFVEDRKPKRRKLARSVGPADAAVAGIEIDGSLVMYDDDPLRWEAAFIAWWNLLPGVAKTRMTTLNTATRRLLMDRLGEPDWHWKQTVPWFPLWVPSADWMPTLSWFVEPATVAKILEGRYEERKPAAKRPEQTIPDVFTFEEHELCEP